MEAVANANRAVVDGYSDMARQQYEMLRELLSELRKIRGDRDEAVKELRKLVERAKKDLQTLQNDAKRTHTKAQKIVSKRVDANRKAWKKLTDEIRKSVSGRSATKTKAGTRKKGKTPVRKASRKKANSGRRAARK